MSRVREESNSQESRKKPVESDRRWLGIAIAIPLVIATGVLSVAKIEQLRKVDTPVSNQPSVTTINALGRIEPRGEVVKLSAPTGAAGRVEQLLVREGEKVRKGQVIAILDSFAGNKAAVEEARAKLQESRANFVSIRTGSPKDIQAQGSVISRLQAQLRGEREAQQATINRLEAQLQGQREVLKATVRRVGAEQRNAEVDAQRYDYLYKAGAISQQERDRRRLSATSSSEQLAESKANRQQTIATLQQQIVEARVNRDKTIATLQQQIEEERTRLSKIEQVNPSNVQIAQAQVNNAIALMRKAEAQLRLSYVMSPINGEILKIYTKAGEIMTANGIAEIGRTDQMIVVAEVPEDSISKIRLGQTANISSENNAFNGTLQGTVAEIGRKIGKKDVLNNDPAADVDARVVEVKIALSPGDSEKVSGLTYAKVVVAINL
ncbi:HlyD family efflux transporter periplasmic adaptor subunit [Calothrix sp. 336/3]|uniref:HlyD family efflux transporter periplasmic adaptor subunit n=1 Tax=Calothrix sp. 336/3 TaxID=1337936 RepID=UPI0004E2ECC0|nr:HlyD family efflux transporter periplasmic adaptor subunit [Calothrix sp. 336/3]AKG22082.1 hemolysin D [Calothrix sp. 336/3]